MLAQSLFAPVASAAPLAGNASASPADDGAFGRLVDQATRQAEPAPLESPPPKSTAKATADHGGPQILPGVEPAPPQAKPVGPLRPEVLPGEEPAPPEVEVLPAEEPLKPAVKPAVTGEQRPEVLPGEVALDPAPRPDVLPGEAGTAAPRPEVLPREVGPDLTGTPKPVPTEAQTLPPAEPAPPPAREVATSAKASNTGASTIVSDGQTSETPAGEGKPDPETATAPQATPPAAAPRSDPARAPTTTVVDGPRAEPTLPPVSESTSATTTEASAPTSDAPIFSLSRVAHETLASLTAQVVKRLEGKYTRFEMALTPEDLGRVDVRLEMGEDGSLTARLAFDSPTAAAEMRAQADQLRRQLEQAGFQLARDALDFSHRDGSASQRQDGFERRPSRAFAAARDLADRAETAPLLNLSLSLGSTRDRVDVKV